MKKEKEKEYSIKYKITKYNKNSYKTRINKYLLSKINNDNNDNIYICLYNTNLNKFNIALINEKSIKNNDFIYLKKISFQKITNTNFSMNFIIPSVLIDLFNINENNYFCYENKKNNIFNNYISIKVI